MSQYKSLKSADITSSQSFRWFRNCQQIFSTCMFILYVSLANFNKPRIFWKMKGFSLANKLIRKVSFKYVKADNWHLIDDKMFFVVFECHCFFFQTNVLLWKPTMIDCNQIYLLVIYQMFLSIIIRYNQIAHSNRPLRIQKISGQWKHFNCSVIYDRTELFSNDGPNYLNEFHRSRASLSRQYFKMRWKGRWNWHTRFSVMTPFRPEVLKKKPIVAPSFVILQLELNVSFMHPSPLSFWIVSLLRLRLLLSTVPLVCVRDLDSDWNRQSWEKIRLFSSPPSFSH